MPDTRPLGNQIRRVPTSSFSYPLLSTDGLPTRRRVHRSSRDSGNETKYNSTHLLDVQTKREMTEREQAVKDYIRHSVVTLSIGVLIILSVFFIVMTFNLWSTRKRYLASLRNEPTRRMSVQSVI